MSGLPGRGWESTQWGESESETFEGLMEAWTGDKKERKGLNDMRNN